jgi:aldehyde reductase
MTVPKIQLGDGNQMPIIGLGTWKSAPGDVYKAVSHAIDAGYRHIDCALAYQNEDEVGKAIREKIAAGVIKREDIFVTSKCWNTFHPRELVVESFNKTMKALDIGYLDLFLIHWPISYKEGGELFPRDGEGQMITTVVDYMDTWKGMEELHKAGKVKSIGLSNFNSEQITRILKEGSIRPVMNQVECHPYLNQNQLLKFCKEKQIALTAYCPLGSPDRPAQMKAKDEPTLLDHPVIKELAEKHKKTPGHILIKFQVQRGVVVIPKSVTPARIEANLNVFDFELSDEDLSKLNALDSGYRFCSLAGNKDHPHYPFNLPY